MAYQPPLKKRFLRSVEYERKCCSAHSEDVSAVTAVKFCAEHPYGKAVALLDTESQLIMVHFYLSYHLKLEFSFPFFS